MRNPERVVLPLRVTENVLQCDFVRVHLKQCLITQRTISFLVVSGVSLVSFVLTLVFLMD